MQMPAYFHTFSFAPTQSTSQLRCVMTSWLKIRRKRDWEEGWKMGEKEWFFCHISQIAYSLILEILPLWVLDQGAHNLNWTKIKSWILDLLTLFQLGRDNFYHPNHTTYSWNIKWQKCAGISGSWVLNEIIQKRYPENMKKIVGAV